MGRSPSVSGPFSWPSKRPFARSQMDRRNNRRRGDHWPRTLHCL